MESAEQKSGFVAGTIVHTREGLVPIERIKVGDWVLSQPESKGEKAYKRVTQIFVHEAQEICLFTVGSGGTWEDEVEAVVEETICVTADHPFWRVHDACWHHAESFDGSCKVELQDGGQMNVWDCQKIYRRVRLEKGIGYAIAAGAGGDACVGFSKIDFCGEQHQVSPQGEYYWLHGEYQGGRWVNGYYQGGQWVEVDDHPDDEEYPRYLARVYNLTVEDFHTFYVGRLGVWVHNARGDVIAGPGAAYTDRL